MKWNNSHRKKMRKIHQNRKKENVLQTSIFEKKQNHL